jgi:hypothetical protein
MEAARPSAAGDSPLHRKRTRGIVTGRQAERLHSPDYCQQGVNTATRIASANPLCGGDPEHRKSLSFRD